MKGDISDLKRALASQAQSVCNELLPAGRVTRGEFEIGSIAGEEGKSLKVRVDGPKAGLWTDFAAGKGGDLIDLWCQVRDQGLPEALDDIRSYLGIEKPQFIQPVKREYKRPERPAASKPRDAVTDYLIELRNLNQAVIDRYKIAELDGNICFPFLRDGELIMYKVREPVDGAKPKPLVADCEKILFGWQAIDPNARTVVITEGEIDALSMAVYGYDALSVPFGGGGGNKQDWIENEFDNLSRFETIYLALDTDVAGQEAVAEIAKRLGRHRCRVVQLPRKDANDCLNDGVVDGVHEAVKNAAALDPDQLSKVMDFSDRVVELFYPPNDEPVGHMMPYYVFGRKLVFRPGEVTVWTGATGSGKSQLLSDCLIHWSHNQARVVLASLEMAPAQTLKRMVKQISGIGGDNARPTESHIKNCLEWLDPSLLIYNRVGKDTVANMLEAFDYCAAAYGSDTFVIDSLMRCGIPQDDYNAQEQAMFEIVDFAIQRNVHIHLVAHTRKQGAGAEKGPPDNESVKGTMEITANAFNVIGVWRDKDWEKLSVEAEEGTELTDAQQGYLDAGGVVVSVSKQRNGDWTGAKRLHFDLDCYQYWSNREEKKRSISVLAA